MAYLLDSNVFIQAKNLYYGLDYCPAFWDWLVAENASGRVFSIEKVGDELEAGSDELATWAGARGDGFFLRPTNTDIAALGAVGTWVTTGQRYEAAAVGTFFQVADYYLIGYALARQHVVVTHEIPSTSARKIKIPNVCVGLGIKFHDARPRTALRLLACPFGGVHLGLLPVLVRHGSACKFPRGAAVQPGACHDCRRSRRRVEGVVLRELQQRRRSLAADEDARFAERPA